MILCISWYSYNVSSFIPIYVKYGPTIQWNIIQWQKKMNYQAMKIQEWTSDEYD